VREMPGSARSTEPLWWSLFSAGGVVAAVLLPVLIVLTGIAIPAGWLSQASALDLVQNPLARLYLLAAIALPLFHFAHRFRFALLDMGVAGARRTVATLCYGTAIAGTIVAAVLLVRL